MEVNENEGELSPTVITLLDQKTGDILIITRQKADLLTEVKPTEAVKHSLREMGWIESDIAKCDSFFLEHIARCRGAEAWEIELKGMR